MMIANAAKIRIKVIPTAATIVIVFVSEGDGDGNEEISFGKEVVVSGSLEVVTVKEVVGEVVNGVDELLT